MREASEAANVLGRGLARAARTVFVLACATASALDAATYLPMPDADLAARAPVVVRVRAGESAGRVEGGGRGPEIVTLTDFEVIEVLKGKVPYSSIRLVLPGGEVEDRIVWIPGRPGFVPGQEAVLFVAPIAGRPGEYGATEFALSVFDVLEDTAGRRFAVRSQFQAGEEEVQDPDGGGPAEPDHVRDLSSFLAALRVAGGGGLLPAVQKASPAGPLRLPVTSSGGAKALWVNIGGTEGSGNQFKWFWSTGTGCTSPNGVVHPVGTQTNLTDGSNGYTHVQNAATQWAGVSGADVRYSYSASSGNVNVNLDVNDDTGSGWSAPMDCAMGVLGVGGPSANCAGSFPPVAGTVYSCNTGNVWMRRSICATGYTVAVFRSAVLHEVGHTLGLGHPDQGQSTFSTTTSSQWNSAVMRSTIPSSRPDTPQSDDIAGIQFYYGAAGPPPAPVANFTFSPTSPVAGQTVAFTDASTNSPTSWLWEFGDGFTSTVKNPTHAFSSAGTYGVKLTATNAGGSGAVTKQVGVSPVVTPVASFSFSPPGPVTGQAVSFFDESANSPTSWSWTFGDGGTSGLRNPTHAYAAPGNYTVFLTATNAAGSSATSRSVTVTQSAAPVADFAWTPFGPLPGQAITFTDQSSGGPTSWLWTFGDGTTSLSANPVKSYSSAGTWNVTLEVSNAFGSSSRTKPVTVSAAGSAPVASFTFTPASPLPGQTVQFTDTSTGGPTGWTWDFGDGTFSAAQNPTKAYGGAGTLTVRLTAYNAFGSSVATKPIVVATANRAPTAVADGWSVATGTTLAVSAPGVLANDTDPDGDPLSAALVAAPGTGTFGLQASGAFSYTPPAGFTGTVSFIYRAEDGKGGVSANATATITVTPSETERVVPIVLDAFGVGSSRFRSELVVANRGATAATVDLTYTAASALGASGTGTVTETLGAGRQLVLDDALAWLRSRGLPIPQAAAGASQGGSLRVRFRGLSSADAGAAFARTTALLPDGRAGVAYPGLLPSDWDTPLGQNVFGLRETEQSRSNLALVNLGSSGDVGLRITLFSGTYGDRRTYVLPDTYWLQPLQWVQISGVLGRAGFDNGYALVERVAGTSPFYAYGVFNDNGTNDGSFIDPIPVAAGVSSRIVPVVLELGIYASELILTNPSASTVAVELRYVESLSAEGTPRSVGTDLLQPREQKIVEAIPHLRALGVDVGAAGGSYAGSVVASFSVTGRPENGFAGGRAKSPGPAGGSYGVYYSGLGSAQAAASEAWVYGLKQDGESRTNVAVAHAEPGGAPIVLQAQVFDGETGASVGGTGNVTLKTGQWFQWNQLLSSFGLRQGYVRVFRVSGASRFLAYAVVNDGGTSRPGTNDGSYVPMVPVK